MKLDQHMRRIIDHLWGPTGSVILHIIIVILLINYLVFETRDRDSEVEVQMMEMETVELEELDKVLEDIEEVNDMEEMEQPPIEDTPPEPTDVQNAEPEMDTTALEVQSDFQGPLVLKGLFAGRSASGRSRMLNDYAGKWGEYTEPAVLKALEWLKKHQIKQGSNKGSWKTSSNSDVYKAAITGMGLLAFLAHGETTGSKEFGDTVERAIKYLRESQKTHGPEGGFCRITQQGAYAHGIATYAIAEAYALTRIPDLKESMDSAVRVVLNGQQPGGGWDYRYDKGARRDTSVSGWQIQALKAAYMGGCKVEGIKESLNKAVQDLKRAYIQKNSNFAYTQGRSHPSTTSIGVLCLQLLGHGRDDEVTSALDNALSEEECDWETGQKNVMYKWYYLTQAKFHAGGRTWKNWNNQFAPAYVESQAEDGHWESPSKKDNRHLKAYTTSLGALTLQVYYRFLPTYKSIAVEKVETGTEEEEEEIEIDII